jgi:hypothetical protein
MDTLFNISIRDKKLLTFQKHCESILSFSDTVLIKIKKRGLFISLTDSEGFCCAETRISMKPDQDFVFNQECSAKILLPSLIALLKQTIRVKHGAYLFMTEDHKLEFRDLNILNATNKVIKNLEHRERDFFILSTKKFLHNEMEATQFKLVNFEFVRIITRLVISSGASGGIARLEVEPDGQDCKIMFSITSDGASMSTNHIYANKNTTDCTMIVTPSCAISCNFLLTYLKRCQILMLSSPFDYTTIFMSKKGILLQTDFKDCIRSSVFISAISNVNTLQELYG